MSERKSSHRTIFLIVSSGSPLALIASSLRSTSKKPVCPMTRSLHPPMAHCRQRVRFAVTWREEFFEVPPGQFDILVFGPGWRGLDAIRSTISTRVHHAAQRRGGHVAARGAGAAGGQTADDRVLGCEYPFGPESMDRRL